MQKVRKRPKFPGIDRIDYAKVLRLQMPEKGSGNVLYGRQGIAFFPLSYSGVVRGKLHHLLIFHPETDCGKHRSCGVVYGWRQSPYVLA
jgi:hypothetical protein